MAAEFSFERSGDKILVTETWRLDDPDLPFIVSPWHPAKEEIQRALGEAKTLSHRYPMPEGAFIDRFGLDDLPSSA